MKEMSIIVLMILISALYAILVMIRRLGLGYKWMGIMMSGIEEEGEEE